MSDGTTHDPSFMQQLLEDKFNRWEIRDETIVVKRDKGETSGHLNFTVHLRKNIMSASHEYISSNSSWEGRDRCNVKLWCEVYPEKRHHWFGCMVS